MKLFDWFAGKLISFAIKREYRKGHLLHADGTLYMQRFQLFETKWLSARMHHIVTADWDRHFHDHPWWFVSVLLRGGYVEARPVSVAPCFREEGTDEACFLKYRHTGSVNFRRATDRHRITWVAPHTWSLFVYGPVRQWWGFYTPQGKIHFSDYPSMHVAGVITSSKLKKEQQA